MTWWRAALTAEAAVLAADPSAPELCREARALCATSPVLSLVVRRAESLAARETGALARVAEDFLEAGAPYQQARTLHLAGGHHQKSAREAFARLHATEGSAS